jgi:hypothetical protein
LYISELKVYGTGLFQAMKKRKKKWKPNQRKKRKNDFGIDGMEKQ